MPSPLAAPPGSDGGRARRLTARALAVAASVALVLLLIAGYVRIAGVAEGQFANRAVAALHDPTVKSLVAEKVTDDVVLKEAGDLIALRPLIEAVAERIVGGRAFTGLFRKAARDVHRAVFDHDQSTVSLTLGDVGTVIGAALQRFRPKLARKVEHAGNVVVVKQDIGGAAARVASAGADVRALTWILLGVWLMLLAGALAVAPDRRQAIVELGIGAAVGGVVLLGLYGAARSYAVHQVPRDADRAAAGAVWDAFLKDLRTVAWIVAGCGAVVAAAALSVLRPVEIGEPLKRLGARLRAEPRRRGLRALRGAGLVAAGLLLILDHDAVLAFAVAAIGIYLVYEGLSVLLQLVNRPAAPAGATGESTERRLRPLFTGVLAGGVVAIALAAIPLSGATTTAAPAAASAGGCDGHAELCDRPLARVALPATHNAMSVPLPGWFSSEQERPIAGQLRDGIRGLLIDTHYADRLPNGKVRTYFGSNDELRRQVARDGVSPSALDAAMRIRERLGFRGQGTRGIYLCHTFCELGATPLASVLTDLRAFLVANPGAIVVVVNQDAITPADFVAAIRHAGLERLAYAGPITDSAPTLQQMIDAGTRLVLLAEQQAGGAPWYRTAYGRLVEETPYTFKKLGLLTDPAKLAASCRPNRGPARGPLFLVNHWISTDPLPRPGDAARVNAYRPLLARARECERVRRHIPNLIAVNFYRRGDLFRVVDTLNGVR